MTTPSLSEKQLPEQRLSAQRFLAQTFPKIPANILEKTPAKITAKTSAVGFLLIALLFVVVLLQPAFSSHQGLLAAPEPMGNYTGNNNNNNDKAKNNYALIAGTVWGPDDHPVYGVPVKIRRATDKPTKTRWQVYSDHMGEFAQRVPTGEADYILTVDLKGFKTVDARPLRLVKEVTVHIYQDEREDTGLHLTIEEASPSK